MTKIEDLDAVFGTRSASSDSAGSPSENPDFNGTVQGGPDLPYIVEGLEVSHITTDRWGDEYLVTLGPEYRRCRTQCDYWTFETTDVELCHNCDSTKIPVELMMYDD